jgi:hypothetical protein
MQRLTSNWSFKALRGLGASLSEAKDIAHAVSGAAPTAAIRLTGKERLQPRFYEASWLICIAVICCMQAGVDARHSFR